MSDTSEMPRNSLETKKALKLEDPFGESSPENLRETIRTKAAVEVHNFESDGAKLLDAARNKADTEQLVIEQGDVNTLSSLNEEANKAKGELLKTLQGEQGSVQVLPPLPEVPPPLPSQEELMRSLNAYKAKMLAEDTHKAQVASLETGAVKLSFLEHTFGSRENASGSDYENLFHALRHELMVDKNPEGVTLKATEITEWRDPNTIDVVKVEGVLKALKKEEQIQARVTILNAISDPSKKENCVRVIDGLSDSLEIEDAESGSTRLHMEHLGLLPENLIAQIKLSGLQIKVSNVDVVESTDYSSVYSSQPPRGWESITKNWQGVPGCYDRHHDRVHAGNGKLGHGSSSLILHELGHGIGHKMGLDDQEDTIKAHTRLFDNLPDYLKQGGAGAFAGRQELLAESFADFFVSPKETFVGRYDKDWYQYFEDLSKKT